MRRPLPPRCLETTVPGSPNSLEHGATRTHPSRLRRHRAGTRIANHVVTIAPVIERALRRRMRLAEIEGHAVTRGRDGRIVAGRLMFAKGIAQAMREARIAGATVLERISAIPGTVVSSTRRQRRRMTIRFRVPASRAQSAGGCADAEDGEGASSGSGEASGSAASG